MEKLSSRYIHENEPSYEVESFTVTRSWIKQNASDQKNGTGWTRRQLEILGVEWPPKKWLSRVVGKKITWAQKTRFEEMGAARRKRISEAPPSGEIRRLIDEIKAKNRYLLTAKQKELFRAIARQLGVKVPKRAHDKLELLKQFVGMEADPLFFDVAATPPRRKKLTRQTRRTYKPKDEFYDSREWLELRYKAIKLYGRKCQACGATDTQIHVDHIKPRYHFPELQLELSNLQILCRDCNFGKGAWDSTDWRPKEPMQ